MYSDKIFPRPFPLFVSFFTLFSALLRRLCPYFRRSSPFFLSAPPLTNPVSPFLRLPVPFCPFPRRTNFPALCRRLLSPPSCTAQAFSFSRSLISRRPLSFLSFSLCPLFFPVPRRPTFLYCAGGCFSDLPVLRRRLPCLS